MLRIPSAGLPRNRRPWPWGGCDGTRSCRIHPPTRRSCSRWDGQEVFSKQTNGTLSDTDAAALAAFAARVLTIYWAPGPWWSLCCRGNVPAPCWWTGPAASSPAARGCAQSLWRLTGGVHPWAARRRRKGSETWSAGGRRGGKRAVSWDAAALMCVLSQLNIKLNWLWTLVMKNDGL